MGSGGELKKLIDACLLSCTTMTLTNDQGGIRENNEGMKNLCPLFIIVEYDVKRNRNRGAI